MIAVFMFLAFFSTMFLAMSLTMLRLIIGNIFFIVPSVLYEIDWSAACIVFGAVLAPVFLMTRRYVHIDRLVDNADRRRMDNDRSCVNELRLGSVSDVNVTIKARLADTDRHTNICGLCCCSNEDDQDGE